MNHRHASTRLLALLLGLGIVVACTTVPITGRRQVMMMSEGEEQKLGLDAYQEVLKKAKLATDPEVNAQVARVGRRIADATGKTDYQWEFKAFEDKQANAFCLPGGKIAVYTGILPITRDDAGLAAVIGHEVAHAIARHGGERVSQQGLVQVLLGATSVALSQQNPAVQQVAIAALGGGAAVGYLLPYSRTQESEADYLGLIYMAKAGYHPSAARDLWVRMAEASKGRERPAEFLSTHPSEATRIKQIEGWLPEALKHYQPRP
jgi:metalloendopeptidase OMA1, mitochondrial